MKYSRVAIVDLKTIEECDEAISSIENDYLNCSGGIKAWTSGYTTYLTTAAQNKVDAITRKSEKLWIKWMKDQYKIYVKQCGADVSFEEYEEKEMYC